MAEDSSKIVGYVLIFTEPLDGWGGKGPQEAIWSNPTFHLETVAQSRVQMTSEINQKCFLPGSKNGSYFIKEAN